MAKNCAKKDWLNKENIIFPWLVRVSKTWRTLCENGKPEIFNENGRFPAKTGGLESLYEVLHEVHNIKIHFIVVVVK